MNPPSRLQREYSDTQRRIRPPEDFQGLPPLPPAEQLLVSWATWAAEEFGRDAASIPAASNDVIVRLYQDGLLPPWTGTAIERVGNYLFALTDPRIRSGQIDSTQAAGDDLTLPIVALRLLVNLEMLHRWGYLDYSWPGSLFALPPGLRVQMREDTG